jgi:hypothetical protein
MADADSDDADGRVPAAVLAAIGSVITVDVTDDLDLDIGTGEERTNERVSVTCVNTVARALRDTR